MRMFNTVKAKVSAKIQEEKELRNFQKTSQVSKMAKMLVIALLLMIINPTTIYAAGFIAEAIGQLGMLITAIGGGLGIWGIVNLLEGYGADNPGAKSQGIKQLMAGGALILIGQFAPGALGQLFTA